MSRPLPEDREELAKVEIGHTAVSQPLGRCLVLALLLTAALPSALEVVRDVGAASGNPWRELARGVGELPAVARRAGLRAFNRDLLAAMKGFEDRLEEDSVVSRAVLPAAQWVLTAGLAAGNQKTYAGRGGWLFFRPAVDSLTGPPFLDRRALARRAGAATPGGEPVAPDPRPAVTGFAAELAARGVALVVMPTPVKATVHPERLAPPFRRVAPPVANPSFGAFVHDLESRGLRVFDPTPVLVAARAAGGGPQFLAGDSHWTPAALERVARELAAFVTERVGLPPRPPVAYRREALGVSGEGDLVRLLDLPSWSRLFPPQRVVVQRVLAPGGGAWEPDPGADVLLLGDSFTNVYSQPELGWGEGAGLAEQLAYFLRRPVDRIAVNGDGAFASRERLARSLAGGEDRLGGKRLVILQFASRELAVGDWKPIGLPAPGVGARRLGDRRLGDGFVVWESNRGGDWRIWTRRLDGSGLRQLSPDEPGQQHCCPHLSPDGSRLVYLARPVGRDTYPQKEVPGSLRLIGADGGGQRTLVAGARTYGWGDRAAVWRNDDEVIYVGADGRTYLLDVASGRSRPLTEEPRASLGWLIDATLGHAVTAAPNFSPYSAAARAVAERQPLAGCEPYFSHDGRWGFWVAGGGGPINRIDLVRRRVATILERDDPRLGGERGYLYFPMLSRDGRLLAYGASAGPEAHDHFRADYDVYVIPVDPATLEPRGRPVRMTRDPATDRYPDVFAAPPEPGAGAGEEAPGEAGGGRHALGIGGAAPGPVGEGGGEKAPQQEEGAWPADRRDLAFLWQTADQPNLVRDPRTGLDRAFPLTPHGRARIGGDGALVLAPGASFEVPPAAAENLLAAMKVHAALTLEATLLPARLRTAALAPIVSLRSRGGADRMTLGQEGDSLVLRVRDAGDPGTPSDRRLRLFALTPGEAVHVVVSYEAGRLRVFRGGEAVALGAGVDTGFAGWRRGRLFFGGESGQGGEGWSGELSGVALYGRALEEAEARENAGRYRRFLAGRERGVERLTVRARLLARSAIPTLAEISPYRQALAVYEYRVLAVVAGRSPGERLRVAHWVLLDGERQPIAGAAPGQELRLVLEPFAANPQLTGHFLADTLPPAPGLPLYYAVEQ
jgi:alginate O-acetyltransferase complex protein AlgJ